GNLFLIVSDAIRFMVTVKQCRFVFHQGGNGKRRLACSGDVLQSHKLEKVCRKAALRVVDGAIAVRKMYAVFCPPFLPLLKDVHHVAAVLMQSEEKPPECPHAAEEKVAQLLEEFAFQVWQRNRVKAGKDFWMFSDHRMVLGFLPPSAIRHIGNIVIQDERILVLSGNRRGCQRSQDAELRVSVLKAQ